MEVIITPDLEPLYANHSKETNTMTRLNPRPVYQGTANPNATNSELDAKVVINHNNKYPRLSNTEWDTIFSLIDDKYVTIRSKLLSYKEEDVIVNRLCDTNLSAYDSIPQRY
jgi:hypothetical protein|tara:strand:- start:436 stop:771 length:336 start_codon:yes stop_codon:yes gene_type:complete